MFMQRDLSWMVGFPVASDAWLSMSLGLSTSRQRLDRELLHESTLAVRKLVRGFPKALPRLVGDPEGWASIRLALIESLKPAIHQRRPLPDEPLAGHPQARESHRQLFRSVRREAPRLARLTSALTWLCWTDLASLRPALRWLRAHQRELEALEETPGADLTLAVRLWQLRRAHGERRVAPFLDWLSRPELFTVPTECPEPYGQQAAAFFQGSRSSLPQKPEPQLGASLIAWVHEVATRDDATRKRALDLLPLLLDFEPLAQWQAWWQRAESTLGRARKLHRQPSKIRQQRKGNARLRKLDSQRPRAFPARRVLRILSGLSSTAHLELYRAIVPRLRRWPERVGGYPVRLAFACYWYELVRPLDAPTQGDFRQLARELCDFWRSRDFHLRALKPWEPVWRAVPGSRPYFHLDWILRDMLPERGKIQAFFEMLSKVRAPVSEDQAELLAFLISKLPPARVESAFDVLRDDEQIESYLPEELIVLADRLTASEEEHLLPVFQALRKHQRRLPVESLRSVAAELETIGRPWIARRCIEAGHLGLLVEVSQRQRFVFDLGCAPPAPSLQPVRSSGWWERYPAALGPALRELDACDDRAERSAGRLLRKEFPDPAALRREIDALRCVEHPEPAVAHRLRNLEARLEAEPRVPAGRLANLEEKLLTAAARRLVERWSQALRRAYDEALLHFLGGEALPSWSARDDVRQALLASLELEPAFRKLARRLFRRRCRPGPWDGREHPANAAFLARMAALGIDTGPWIDSGPTLQAGDIQLALERDPLEILHMGGHFRTCLSPGQFNHFSVYANACDINKQVLYARDARGNVVARMLLALTAEGGLLCFHPYQLDSELGFEALAQDYAQRLADAMGTLVVPRGHVPQLVAPDWWDDGPTDLADRHPALEPSSDLRRALAELPPAQLAGKISAAFAPLACNELTLPLVLQLPELDARPELASGVARLAERLELPTDAMLRLGQLLLAAGDIEQGRTLAPRLKARALARHRQFQHDSFEIVELLAGLDPSRALRLLRQTRSRGVRRWEQETDFKRLALGARASRQLGRRKQARKLLERARHFGPDPAAKAECDRLLAELDGAGR
ncbi:MAG: hypothetical protein AAF560_16295 [Acidobacteriota bacterium]